jgi:hypothetical protein
MYSMAETAELLGKVRVHDGTLARWHAGTLARWL